MSILGFYFVTSLLREAGWPRKQGLFRRAAIDTIIADSATDQMVDWAASLGAGRPTLALQIIAEMFRDRNWDGDDAPQVAVVINGSRELWDKVPNAGPREIVQPIRLANHFGRTISPKRFQAADMSRALEQYLLEALSWGLANPERFATWYADTAQRHASKLRFYQKCGLAVDVLPALDGFFDQSEQIVRNYERDVKPLPIIPDGCGRVVPRLVPECPSDD